MVALLGSNPHKPILGILSFEAARTMSRLLALHRSLSAKEIVRLRSQTMRSTGVAFLVSSDNIYLIRLACAELLHDLDRAAASVSRLLGKTQADGFDKLYSELKSGSGCLGLALKGKELQRGVKKMERYVSIASRLLSDMEELRELEATERKMKRCTTYDAADLLRLRQRLSSLRRAVGKLQEGSIWSDPRGKVVGLMARMVVSVFARLCAIFAPVALELPLVVPCKKGGYVFSSTERLRYQFSGRPTKVCVTQWTSEVLEAPRSTLGGSGLALRYAEVLCLAKKMVLEGEEWRREELYGLLPSGIRGRLRRKLRTAVVGEGDGEGWKGVAKRMMEWLGPVGEDTKRWYEEGSCERRRGDGLEEEERKRVWVLQTLVFADREKAEAAVVEVLVALSCAWTCEKSSTAGGSSRRSSDLDFC